ncbi:DUF4405 domain-containing protein [Camelimonas fluminis]|uniref:DUF4405 domain-containing protein n=1 Tax=Camelimonas fluminis TaxID=1576911 RepID=A0ABV7UMI7_9HYPH|nr:DUF4405 domain-containing protein [Camelimonas fluminis]
MSTAANSLYNRVLTRYATPLTTGLFLVSAISGVALFFRWTPRTFHAMHEWLSMLLLAPFILHMVRNWRPLVNYAKRKTLFLPLVLSLAIAIPFAVSGLSGPGRAGNPAFRALPLMTQARLADLAPLLKTSPDKLLATLRERGYQATSIEENLETIAGTAGKKAPQVLVELMPRRQGS